MYLFWRVKSLWVSDVLPHPPIPYHGANFSFLVEGERGERGKGERGRGKRYSVEGERGRGRGPAEPAGEVSVRPPPQHRCGDTRELGYFLSHADRVGQEGTTLNQEEGEEQEEGEK